MAAALILAVGTGAGTILRAEEQEMPGKSGGGIYGTEVQELTREPEQTETKIAASTEKIPELKEPLKDESELKSDEKSEKQRKHAIKKAKDGQVVLDVSRGNIRITASGALIGSTPADSGVLNPQGYRITGKTTTYNIVVEPKVKTDLTFENVDISCAATDSLNVSHADVTVTLIGKNRLYCTKEQSNALTKDGMDGSLTLRCEYSGQKGHKCDADCGSITVQGVGYHVGALGNSIKNRTNPKESGFCDFTIEGGNITALGGGHCPAIGAACWTEHYVASSYAKDIYIKGGNVEAIGTSHGSGIGSGYGTKVDGVYISGGVVKARGGENAPGIGASKGDANDSMITRNIRISGGDTVVTAVGDSKSNMPGIGSAAGNEKVSGVTAAPETGYQGYVQDGTSLTDFIFTENTPFAAESSFSVGNFFTQVYFGPFRDSNSIDSATKEQIGANHVISRTGGKEFSREQIRTLAKVTAKDKNGNTIDDQKLLLDDESQLSAVNQAKKEGKTGDFFLTFRTESGTKVTVTVSLRNNGTDAQDYKEDDPISLIGANHFEKDSGGDPFTEEQLKQYGQVKGKDQEGNNIELKDFQLDQEQVQKINKTKADGKSGIFDLTFSAPDGVSVTVKVTLNGTFDEAEENPDNGEIIKAKNIISKTGGEAFTEEQLKEISRVKAEDNTGQKIASEDIGFADLEEVKCINDAKIAGEIGEYPLTFRTPEGTDVKITVFLRQKGSDSADYGKENINPFIGANDVVLETGGEHLAVKDMIDLCEAKGKDQYGDNAELCVDEKQLQIINEAKAAGKTGTFDFTFVIEGGSASVKVTLIGSHVVSFDPNGGENATRDQIIEGGKTAVEPKDPVREGYTFKGWYVTDDDGREVLWDFNMPVHQNMVLRAKWEITPEEDPADSETASEKTETTDRESGNTWEYREVDDKKKTKRAVAETNDGEKESLLFLCTVSAAGMACGLWRRTKK